MAELVKRASTTNPAVQTPQGNPTQSPQGRDGPALADDVARLLKRVADLERSKAEADERERRQRELRQPCLAGDLASDDDVGEDGGLPAPTKKVHGIHMALFLAANTEGTSLMKRW
eukprot:CAMPEP_0182480670 /NCGR_PEP_ID=MMETSP1319-20130603/36131_1 /TAXON_ID=172717 /ORGANISM="Bolidomonas pacifica, Strain RCC208" /LENGTH=115 /DNA_ID=CAMNT_0024682191 /DNA_START=11 /DNA_END=355 /DNA_ORIENTATION=-